jgi:hypothetical protein
LLHGTLHRPLSMVHGFLKQMMLKRVNKIEVTVTFFDPVSAFSHYHFIFILLVIQTNSTPYKDKKDTNSSR